MEMYTTLVDQEESTFVFMIIVFGTSVWEHHRIRHQGLFFSCSECAEDDDDGDEDTNWWLVVP